MVSASVNSLPVLVGGRRPSTIWGGVGIAVAMLLIGTLYASHATDVKAGKVAVIALIFIFLVSYAMSWAVVIRVYASEIQPMKTRAAATALGQAANWVRHGVIRYISPPLMFVFANTLSDYQLAHSVLHATVPGQIQLRTILPLRRVRSCRRRGMLLFPAGVARH